MPGGIVAGVNKVIIVGRVGNTPDVQLVGAQATSVVRLSVATSERWKDKSGEYQEKTEWHRVTAWGKLAEICGKHLEKGRQVYIEGKLQTNQYEKDGQKHYSTNIIAETVQFLGSAPNSGSAPGAGGFQDFGPEPSFNSNDEIPF